MKKNKKGFTLVELVIVVAVMAVLIAVAIPTVTSISTTARKTVADTNARTIESTIKLAEAELSKDGDVIKALDAAGIAKAVNDAKLGITSGSFIYNATKGTVIAVYESKDLGEDETAATAVVGEFTITFTNGVAAVVEKTA